MPAAAPDSRIYRITGAAIVLAIAAISLLVLTGAIARIVREPT